MTIHALFAPSSAHRWIPCPGSLAFPENQADGGSSTFADDGTASHEWSAYCLKKGVDAESLLGAVQELNGKQYVMDEERAAYCQMYIDDVRRRALGHHLMVELKLDLQPHFGPEQFGTADALVLTSGESEYHPQDEGAPIPTHDLIVVEDLKYGTGEQVYAKLNAQGMSYALGALDDARMLGYEPSHVLIVISQPRKWHLDEWLCSIAELEEFRRKAQQAISDAGKAMILPQNSPELNLFLSPDKKTCRWCRAATRCPKLAKMVEEEVRQDFETILIEPPVLPTSTAHLTRAMNAIPLIEQWCKAVRAEVDHKVRNGEEVLGPDGKPYKIVEGEPGKREWIDLAAAEAALLGQLTPDKVYAPRKIITAPVAGALLDKKATKQLWKDVFAPLIHKKPGQPFMVLGSDDRPPYTGGATAEDFAIGTLTE